MSSIQIHEIILSSQEKNSSKILINVFGKAISTFGSQFMQKKDRLVSMSHIVNMTNICHYLILDIFYILLGYRILDKVGQYLISKSPNDPSIWMLIIGYWLWISDVDIGYRISAFDIILILVFNKH